MKTMCLALCFALFLIAGCKKDNVVTPQASIVVTLPIGGSAWTVSAPESVKWTSHDITGKVNIRLSYDGGANWIAPPLVSSTADDGFEIVSVKNVSSTHCVIRVESSDNPNVFGINVGEFGITDTSLWQMMGNGLPHTNAITAFAKDAQFIYAGFWGGDGVYRSSDQGQNWVKVNAGLTEFASAWVASLLVNGQYLFLGSGGSGVFVSNNSGSTWNKSGLASVNLYIGQVIAGGGYVYASYTQHDYGIRRSSDNGVHWDTVNTRPINAQSMTMVYKAPYLITGTSDGKLWRTSNNGTNWEQLNWPTGVGSVMQLIVCQDNLIAASQFSMGGIYQSSDNGSTWVRSNTGLPAGPSITSLYAVGRNVFAGVWKNSTLYLSTDQGSTWNSANWGIPSNIDVNAMISDGTYLYLGSDGAIDASQAGALYRRPLTGMLPSGAW